MDGLDFFEESLFRDPPTTGAYLVPNNTGTGKTTAAAKGVTRFALDPSWHRRLVFVSSQWNNIPEKQLVQAFDEAGGAAEYGKKVLVLRSPPDCFLDRLEEVVNDLPEDLRNHESCIKCRQRVREYRRIKDDPGLAAHLPQARKNLEEVITSFRKSVTKWFKQTFADKDERVRAIRPTESEAWAGVLFPSARVGDPEVKIVLLTTAMLLRGGSRVVEDGHYAWIPDLVDEAVVFLDEFDQAKIVMIQELVNQALSQDFDLIQISGQVIRHLRDHTLPLFLAQETPERLERINEKRRKRKATTNIRSLEDERLALVAKGLDLFDRWNLDHNHLLDRNGTGPGLLFAESQYGYRVGGTDLICELQDDRLVHIKRKPIENESFWLHRMVSELMGYFREFAWYTRHLANNAASKRTEAYGPAFLALVEKELESVLSHFSLGEEVKRYIRNLVMSHGQRNHDGTERWLTTNLFHQEGFRLIELEDSELHEYQTWVRSHGLHRTPEDILLSMARISLVVGLSATCLVPSVVSNFQLDYLRHSLGPLWHDPSTADLERRVAGHEALRMGYRLDHEKGKLHCTTVVWIDHMDPDSDEATARDCWEALMPQHVIGSMGLFNQCHDAGGYQLSRYIRVIGVLKTFAEHSECRACLAFFPVKAEAGKSDFDVRIIESMARALGYVGLNDNRDSQRPVIAFLTKEDIGAGFPAIKKILKAGGRVLAFTAYATASIGVNLQYEVDPEEVTGLLDMRGRGKTSAAVDWNGIYLDPPTHIIPQFGFEKDREARLRVLIHRILVILYLHMNGELSRGGTFHNLEESLRVFASRGVSRSSVSSRLQDCPSVGYAKVTMMIQALGRLERTGYKHPNLLIMVSEELKPVVRDCPLPVGMIPLHSYARLVDQAGTRPPESGETMGIRKLEGQCSVAKQRIISMLEIAERRGRWHDGDRQYWEMLREECLRHPVVMAQEDRTADLASMFLDFGSLEMDTRDAYTYAEEDDFEVQHLFPIENTKGIKVRRVSAVEADLHRLVKVPELKSGFETRGWALEWIRGRSLMAPIVFNNIYLGALGEACLRIVLEDVLGVELIPLKPEHYEFFDLMTKDGIYLDSKYWQTNPRKYKPEDQLDKYLNRLDSMGGVHGILVRTAVVTAMDALPQNPGPDPRRLTVLPWLFVAREGMAPMLDPEALDILDRTVRRK